MLSGAALAGWLAGSTLNPPVATTQVVPARPAPMSAARTELPRVAWPLVRPRVAPPAPSRNPFAFHEGLRRADAPRSFGVAADADGAAPSLAPDPDATASAPEPLWRLSGIAASDDGDVVAVISGGGDVHLMRAGDVLPGGDDVLEVGPAHVVVRTAAGPLTLRLP